MLRAFILSVFLLAGTPAMAGTIMTYKDGETTLEGYVARAKDRDAPVVLIVHQWKGLGAYEKSRADMLAAAGYNAFAIDMYGQGVRPQDTDAAAIESSKYKDDPQLARRRLRAALDYADSMTNADTSRIAILGYCFGGTMALEMARSGAVIKSAISFHGGLASKAPATKPGVIQASVAVYHGADDPYVKPEEVDAFVREMNTSKADWVFTEYAGAVHSFTEKAAGNDPSKGVAYNEKADQRSWAAALDFLAETLAR